MRITRTGIVIFNNLDISFYNPDGIIWNYSSYSVDGVDVTEAVLTGEKTAEEAEAYFPNSDSAYVEFGSKCTNIIETLKKLGILNSERKLMTYDEYDALMNPVTASKGKRNTAHFLDKTHSSEKRWNKYCYSIVFYCKLLLLFLA